MKEVIIISGGAGMLGSNFADWVVENHPEYHVVSIDNLFGGYLENVNPKVEFYLRDVGSCLDDIGEKYKGRIKYFYQFASYSAEGASPFLRKFNYTNNVVASANVINFCIKNDIKIIFASSMSVYGVGHPPFKEDDVLSPIDPYAISKYCVEMDLKVAHDHHGLRYSIIRPHNIIGPKQNMWDKYRNCVGIFMRQILNNQPLTIYGDGEQKRAFSYVHDYCEPFWKVAVNDYPDPVFNCGGDKFYTINQLANLLFIVTGKNTGIQYLEPRHEVRIAYCDHTKAKTVLGFEDKTSLVSMLSEMWEWAKVQPNRPVKEWDQFEIENGLYSYWKK